MRIKAERTFETLRSHAHDPLGRYRSLARRAVADPGLDLTSIRFEATEGFDPNVAVAFGVVARFLESIEGENSFAVDRDTALGFLTGPEPVVDTEEDQLVRLHRGADGRVRAATVMRSDGKAVTSSDLRFPFKTVKDFDADHRVSDAWAPKLTLEYSDDTRTRDRAQLALDQLDGMTGDDKYRQAARLYLEAQLAGYSSTRKLIIDEMHVSYNYAGVLISRARDKGYLPPVTKTTKGNT